MKLALVGQAEYNSPFYETDLDEFYEVRAFQMVFDLTTENATTATASSMADLLAFEPDVTVFFRPEFFANDLLSRLRGTKIGISTEPLPKYIGGIFHYTRDSIGRFRHLLRAAELDYDFIFHHDPASLEFMERMGVRLSGGFILPVATNIWREAKARDIRWDGVFLGRSTEHRERFLGPLKRDTRLLHVAHGIVGKDFLPYYQASRIGLNIHVEAELVWEPRVQQLMAAGLLVVSEPISPNDLLLPGVHFVEVREPYQAYETCREILANPDRFESIRRAGMERVRSELSARRTWPVLIERCLSGEPPRPAFDLGRVRLAPLEICMEFTGFEHLLDQLRGDHV